MPSFCTQYILVVGSFVRLLRNNYNLKIYVMRKSILFFLFLIGKCLCISLFAQNTIQYTYDSAGNRTSRMQVSTRSFISFSQDVDKGKMEEQLMKTKVNVYPNPVQSELLIDISELPQNSWWEVQLYDMSGKLLYQRKYDSIQAMIVMDEFLPGSYIVRLIFEQSQFIWKIIKK